MKKILILIILCLVILSSKSVFAQNSGNQNVNQQIKNIFSISPIIVDTAIRKGEKLQIPIKIANDLDQPLGIRVSVENFFPTDGATTIQDFKNSPLVDWSTVSRDNFILDKKQDQTINLTINTPQNLKDGGYYAVVFFTPFYSKPLDNSSPTVLSKVGTLILATAGKINYQNLAQKVSISSMDFGPFYELGSKINYSFAVQNSYFTHFSAKPFLTISPVFGNPQRIELADKRVLPGTSRAWSEELPNKNLSFFNSVNLAISVGEGNYVYKNGLFFILPFKEIFIAILLLLLITVIKFRGKQIKKAIKIVLKG